MFRSVLMCGCGLCFLPMLAESPADLRVFWNNGLRMESADGVHRFQFGGRFQQDFAFFTTHGSLDENIPGIEDGTLFRRARVYFAGSLAPQLLFRTEYDFAGGAAGFRDLWIEAQSIPWASHVRLGRMIEPFGMEGTSPNGFFTFIERGLPAAFTPFRNSGIMIRNHALHQQITWAAGAFTHTDGFGDSVADPGRSVTGRITALPLYTQDGRTWWNVGLSASHRTPSADSVRFRARPESQIAPFFADTGALAAEQTRLIGVETAANRGAVSIQAEAVRAEVDALESESIPAGTRSFQGFYVYGSWMLTGEARPFLRRTATLGRILPNRPFAPAERGFGAWEVAARYSELDLNDGPVTGGKLSTLTLGLNAYLTPNSRLSWNWVRADVEAYGEADIFQMRVYVDF